MRIPDLLVTMAGFLAPAGGSLIIKRNRNAIASVSWTRWVLACESQVDTTVLRILAHLTQKNAQKPGVPSQPFMPSFSDGITAELVCHLPPTSECWE